MGFQRAMWTGQKVGWIVLALLLLLALLGLFSVGPFSSATAVSAGGDLTVDYQRLERSGASSSLRLSVADGPADGEIRVRIGSEFVKAFTIEGITPDPLQTSTGRDGIDLVYPVPSAYPAIIYLSLRPRQTGLVKSSIALNDAESVRLSQFVYP